MNDNEGIIPQQIAHLDAEHHARGTWRMRERDCWLKPGDERLAKQVSALEGLLKGLMTNVERLKSQGK